jgi:23S rRNA (adenine2503-C2)-methyltransferase
MVNLKSLDLAALEAFVASLGWEPYRAKQLFTWIWQKGVSVIDVMTNLAKAKRDDLKTKAHISTLRLVRRLSSKDGTTKFQFELEDGLGIESVFIPDAARRTVCVSSQVGCPLGCDICYTGQLGFKRNLKFHEIADQVLQVALLVSEGHPPITPIRDRSRRASAQSAKSQGQPLVSRNETGAVPDFAVRSPESAVTNVVMMGMGEPMLNLDEVLKAGEMLNSDLGLRIGARHITISTAGIPQGIRKLADYPKQFKLAVSLNAADDKTRSKLMPVNRKYGLDVLGEAIQYYVKKTHKRVTFEYVLVHGVNDRPEDAQKLMRMLKYVPCKINLIPFNSCPNRDYAAPSLEQVEAFAQVLYPHLPAVTIRRSRGSEIRAACGQLAGKPD